MSDFLTRLAIGITPAEVPDIPTASAETVLSNALNIVYFIAGAICVIVIIVAGIMYTTSGGDSGSVTKAKNLILYSVIGLVVILVAFTITWFVIGRF